SRFECRATSPFRLSLPTNRFRRRDADAAALSPLRYSGISCRRTFRRTCSVMGSRACDRYSRKASFIMVWYPVPSLRARARNSVRTALSMKMEIRVFPVIAAPRLPFEKSYSALIGFALLTGRSARRDQTKRIAAFRVDDYHKMSAAVPANPHEALLANGIGILDCDGQRVE